MTSKITLQDCFNTRAYSQEYYPIWRKPLSTLSFYVLFVLVRFFRLKNPYLVSFGTVFFGFFGAVTMFLGYKYIGAVLLIFSYIFDLLDGKVARLFHRENINAKFIDWIYHTTTPTLAIFAMGYQIFLATNEYIFLILPFFIGTLFLHKIFLSFLFLSIQKDILMKNNQYKESLDYEKDVEKTYGNYKNSTTKSLIYSFARLFIDSTDIVFAIFIALLFSLEKYLLILLFLINILLWFYSVFEKLSKLYNLEIHTYGKKS